MHLFAADEHTRACIIRLKGTDPKGSPIEEIIKSSDLRWVLGKAHPTSLNLYQSIQSITFNGLQPEDRFVLETADFSQPDISCLLPLLTQSATPEMIEGIIANPALMAENERLFGLAETWKGVTSCHQRSRFASMCFGTHSSLRDCSALAKQSLQRISTPT